MTNAWKETLDVGNVLLIDGGMGTELQRRGVPMNDVAWSGAGEWSAGTGLQDDRGLRA